MKVWIGLMHCWVLVHGHQPSKLPWYCCNLHQSSVRELRVLTLALYCQVLMQDSALCVGHGLCSSIAPLSADSA
jgi:hypothetical protein